MEPVLQDENFLDAYELIECPVTEIQSMLAELPINLGKGARLGWGNVEVQERTATKIGKFIDELPVQKLSVEEILELNNLTNLPDDIYTLKAIQKVRGKQGYKEVFIEEMLKRDKRAFRDREFPLEPLLEAVEVESCRPLLIVMLDNVQYVVDGRTRLYASIAADKDANVKVIDNTNLKEYLEEIND